MFAAGKTNAVSGQLYVDDVFSTWLVNGSGSGYMTVNTGINYTQGALVWSKNRADAATNHELVDTVRGGGKALFSNLTNAESSGGYTTAFTSTGFDLYTNTTNPFVTWTFREAPKFFDVVTYTGNGVSGRQIAHSLGQVPGMIIVKSTSNTTNWAVNHTSLAAGNYMKLNATDAASYNTTSFFGTNTSTTFQVGSDFDVNANGYTYVAYLFAHDTATDGIIQCGSFTTDALGNFTPVTLGWEPQYLLVKRTNSTGDWIVVDSMRGFNYSSGADKVLTPNTSASEGFAGYGVPTATGFAPDASGGSYSSSSTFIYLAIRRPNKPPTTGTQVFSPNAVNVATGTAITTNFPIDLQIFSLRTGATNKNNVYDRLRGISSNTTESGVRLITDTTAAETAIGNETLGWDNTGFKMTSVFSGTSDIFWNFRRAPGVFDEVCYTGTGASTTQAHNLGAVPELMIVKLRNAVGTWMVYDAFNGNTKYLQLDTASVPSASSAIWNNTTPTTNVFTVGTNSAVNGSGSPYVAYLFATVAGISKVFSYTGNGTSQTINCGFTTGARFVLIKRTDSTGDWYVWDSARGIVAGNDPHLSLNTTAAEVTTNDSVDTDSTGFVVNQLAATNVNVTSATYIGLAFA